MTKQPPRVCALHVEQSPTPAVRGVKKLAPLTGVAVVSAGDAARGSRESTPPTIQQDDDPIASALAAAASRSPPRKYPRLQTLSILVEKHVASMHQGDFVARSKARWQSPPTESGATIAKRVSRESAALVIQSAWKFSAAVRLRHQLVRRIWQEQMELAAWLSSDRHTITALLHVIEHSTRPLVDTTTSLVNGMHLITPWGFSHLQGAYYQLPAMQVATWLMFTSQILQRNRFLRRPAPAILHAVHIPVKRTRRLMATLWKVVVRVALLTIQCRVRTYMARRRYWKLLIAHRRHQAALRVQCLYRAWVANRLVWRLRRRRAAVTIQCGWRCNRARQCVRHRRVSVCASRFLVGVTVQAVQQASTTIINDAAKQIQRVYRGRCARARFRMLLLTREQKQWHRNPSKGYVLFAQGLYSQAAVYLERCFRQGIFEYEQKLTTDCGIHGHDRPCQRTNRQRRHCKRPLGAQRSRAMFSFSEEPIIEEPVEFSRTNHHRVVLNRVESRAGNAVAASKDDLHFWHAYALSHWFAFHSNGDPLHLKQAHVGFLAISRVDQHISIADADPQQQFVRMHARYGRVMCAFLSGEPRSVDDTVRLQTLCIETIDELDVYGGFGTVEMVEQTTRWRNELAMTSASLYVEEGEHEAAATQLQVLLDQRRQGRSVAYDEVELLVLIAVVRLQSPTQEAKAEAVRCLEMAFQIIELWRGVGFYHGQISSAEAVALLEAAPVGSFLLHHEATDPSPDQSNVAASRLAIKVKLGDTPCRVSSLRIHQRDGVYTTKKLPGCSHASVHELLKQLPKAAGLEWHHGVRRTLYTPSLAQKLENDLSTSIRSKRLAMLLAWDCWTWRHAETKTRQNETWSAFCLLIATRLEASDANAMAALVASDGLLTARDGSMRADLFFALGRANAKLQRRMDAIVKFQQAAIERARLTQSFNKNHRAVQRALTLTTAFSEPFSSQLERLGKRERMCVKAWSFDSSSMQLRGSPFCEVLLLQRVDDEADARVADTFFQRSLLRAHIKTFLVDCTCETTHIDLASRCVVRLFEKASRAQHTVSVVQHLTDARLRYHHGATFTIHRLLLSWHHMPFQVCYEVSEVLYRSPASSFDALIDMYESLCGRLRGMKPQTWAYAAYEELFLVRLAFLLAQRSTNVTDAGESARLNTRAIEMVDELIALRRLRTLDMAAASLKRIQWPSLIQYPVHFSASELLFIRGFLWERVATTEARKCAWRDYDELHRELLTMVKREHEEKHQRSDFYSKRFKGVRVFVGETQEVEVGNVLHSKPFVVLQYEGKHLSTQHAATWMNHFSPSWNEHIEIDLASPKARLMLVLMNRSTQRRHLMSGASDQVLGYVQVLVQDVLMGTHQAPQFYDVVTKNSLPMRRPRIKLGFQVVMAAVDPAEALVPKRTNTRMRGHWDVNEVQRYLRGDLQQFITGPWIWRWFGKRWFSDAEFCIAAWFLQRAVDAFASQLTTSADDQDERVEYADDCVALVTCYRATMGTDAAEAFARPLIQQAVAILQAAYEATGSLDMALWKRLTAAIKRSQPATPFATELSKRIPASSRWIAMQRRCGGVYYFNEDTSERFDGVEGQPNLREPLEWEDVSMTLRTTYDPLRPRRVVVLSVEMKARVVTHCRDQAQCCSSDSFQWVAVYNPRKDMMQFLSLTSDDNKDAGALLTRQPPTYAMAADEFLMYHVLVVQAAFRKFHTRQCRRRRLRGLLATAFGLTASLSAARYRLFVRAEAARKQALNCLHVVVEKASKLRAMDLLTSDPFVIVELWEADGKLAARGQTTVRRHTLNPQWHEEFRLHCNYTAHTRLSLRFDVLDYDVVTVFRTTDDEVEAQQPGDTADKHRENDFLGRAVVQMEPLAHGRCVTADLTLLDQEGDESPRPRGELTVTVQWVHDEHYNLAQARRNALVLAVEPVQKQHPKPVLHEDARQGLEQVKIAYATAVQRHGVMAVLAEQLVKLFKRWKIAQQAGRTAEEAKLLEQRLRAALGPTQPLRTKYEALMPALAALQLELRCFCEFIHSQIDEYLSSCESEKATAGHRFLDGMKTATALPVVDVAHTWSVEGFTMEIPQMLDTVVKPREWRKGLVTLLTACFAEPLPTWEDTSDTYLTVAAKTKAMLAEAVAARVASVPPGSAPLSTTLSPQPERSSQPASAAKPSTSASAMAKRLERIEKEKRKKEKTRQR